MENGDIARNVFEFAVMGLAERQGRRLEETPPLDEGPQKI
jgi:hypothetical protein